MKDFTKRLIGVVSTIALTTLLIGPITSYFIRRAEAQTSLCTANCSVTAGSVTIHWAAVTTDINNASLGTSTVTYKVYGSQGCGAKTLQATTTQTSAQITVAAGCYSIAVSASDSAGEGAVSSPSLLLNVVAPQALPAQVGSVGVTQP